MISCSQYDYIELACVFHIQVRITTENGSVFEGIALDTGYNKQKKECLILQTNGQEAWFETDTLTEMQALTPNPHFTLVSFQQIT
ncbi:Rho-binding antiterminator [Vibrio sonorensis]|uniref:Rho-binding antiterminator n=1 Tax=Vibrio sonorensis TaxID=1004316 RepID=UPI0008D9D3BD|nr:Rho-binding antiterminator [Vibrio sonorensis]